MSASQRVWAFIPKKMRTQPREAARGRATVYRYVKIKAISNTWDYTVTL